MTRRSLLRLFVYILETDNSFQVKINRSDNIDDLKAAILKKKPKDLEGVDAADHERLLLYKVNLSDGRGLKQRAPRATAQETIGSQVLSELFPNNPPAKMVHVIVQVPGIGADNWPLKSESSPLDPYVTFVAPAHAQFGLMSYLPHNQIQQVSEELPEFVSEFKQFLSQKRTLNSSGGAILKKHLTKEIYDIHFIDGSEEQVSNDECHSYLLVFESPAKEDHAGSMFADSSEAYAHYFLMELAFNCRKYLEDQVSYISFGKSWRFPLIARVREGPTFNEYSYRPRSDFFISLTEMPIVLLEVCSDKDADVQQECDRPRLLLQAACDIRLLNHLSKMSNVILAAYVDKLLTVSCYFLFEVKDSPTGPCVKYYVETFNLRKPLEGFKFLFQIYNFVSHMKDRLDKSKLKQNISALGTELSKNLPAFTSKDTSTKRRRKDGGGNDGQGRAKRRRKESQTLNQPPVSDALTEKGYYIQLEKEAEGWTPRYPLKPTLSRAESPKHGLVMLKLLDEGSKEHDILTSLNKIKSDDNHVITVLDSFHVDVWTIIALPIASPLHCFTTPALTPALMEQLVKAVNFIHANGVAHLDLKPNNVLVSGTDDGPRLVVIDFGVSVLVQSPEDEIEGFVGTPDWVAPEVGAKDGPRQKYSAIRADRWACGQLLYHMASESGVQELSTDMKDLVGALLSGNPLLRPSLETYLRKSRKHLLKNLDVSPPKRSRQDSHFSGSDMVPQAPISITCR